MSVIITKNATKLGEELGKLTEKIANEAIAARGMFFLSASGGSLITFLNAGLPSVSTDYSKWKIFINDERLVPFDHPDSTYGSYMRKLVGKFGLTPEQFVGIKPGVSGQETAEDYVQKMQVYFKDEWPKFDMILLGMATDGHTCSLYPGNKVLDEDQVWVTPIANAPELPLERITITFPVLNNARYCIFTMAGEEKAEILRKVLVEKGDYPVNRVRPKNGLVYWILDEKAAKELKN